MILVIITLKYLFDQSIPLTSFLLVGEDITGLVSEEFLSIRLSIEARFIITKDSISYGHQHSYDGLSYHIYSYT
jgi:hypothetical protein